MSHPSSVGQALIYLSTNLSGVTTRTAAQADVTLSGTLPISEDTAFNKVVDAGDVDGDGVVDLLVGAPWADVGASDGGLAALFLGSQLLKASDLGPDDAAYTFIGTSEGARSSWRLDAGDFNGDGLSDLLVSAYRDRDGLGSVFVLHTP